jgi:transcriptional regulator with XRE-family HTH domain
LPKSIHTERHKTLRELLIAHRKSAGLTQTVVARRLGKPPSYVAKYEGGDRRLDVLKFYRSCHRDRLRSLCGDSIVRPENS